MHDEFQAIKVREMLAKVHQPAWDRPPPKNPAPKPSHCTCGPAQKTIIATLLLRSYGLEECCRSCSSPSWPFRLQQLQPL